MWCFSPSSLWRVLNNLLPLIIYFCKSPNRLSSNTALLGCQTEPTSTSWPEERRREKVINNRHRPPAMLIASVRASQEFWYSMNTIHCTIFHPQHLYLMVLKLPCQEGLIVLGWKQRDKKRAEMGTKTQRLISDWNSSSLFPTLGWFWLWVTLVLLRTCQCIQQAPPLDTLGSLTNGISQAIGFRMMHFRSEKGKTSSQTGWFSLISFDSNIFPKPSSIRWQVGKNTAVLSSRFFWFMTV